MRHRFADFEFNDHTSELKMSGRPVEIQSQPARLCRSWSAAPAER